MRGTRGGLLLVVVFAHAFALAACGRRSTGDLPHVLSTGEAFPGTHCSAFRPPTEPDLLAWDPASRAALATLRMQGVVAVRYRAEGCNLELEMLPNCIGAGTYNYVPYAASDTKIARNSDELFAELPLGAARLGAKMREGRALRTDYRLVGMASLPSGVTYKADDLRGPGCDRATHVVGRVYLGGFSMVAGDAHSLEASAGLFGTGVGAGAKEESIGEHVAHEGIATACENAQVNGKENAQCAVPLRVGLLPIAGRVRGACPADSTFDGQRCVRREVITKVECPLGTVLDGNRCHARVVDTSCAAGLHYEPGRGCEPNPPPPPPPPPKQPPPARKGGARSSAFFAKVESSNMAAPWMDARVHEIVERTHGPLLRRCFTNLLDDNDEWSMTIELSFRERGERLVSYAVAHQGRNAKGTPIGEALIDCATQTAMWPWPVSTDATSAKGYVAIVTGMSLGR